MAMQSHHHMHLHPEPFAMVAQGTKTVEMPLNDEKRQGLAVGDTIEFESRAQPGTKVLGEIVALPLFKNFKDAFYAFPPEAYGGTSPEEYECMYKYYSKEEEEKYGVVAIQFELKQ